MTASSRRIKTPASNLEATGAGGLRLSRRALLAAGAAAALPDARGQAAAIPIIDTHIHLFDTTRPQGVPWPEKDNALLYKPALPDRYRQIAVPMGILGAIEVEASPWLEDNQWVLDVLAKDTIMVGTVGDLEPGKPGFRENLERFHRNRLFVGIRYGNLWGRNLGAELAKPEFISGMKDVAAAGLTLDTANPNAELMEAVVRLTDRVPDLRVVIDHLPQMEPPAAPAVLHRLAQRQVWVKVSEVVRRVNNRVPTDLAYYKPRLDQIWEIFGEDRLLYGSDWPNSDNWAPYRVVLSLVQEYFRGKGRAAAEKYFWKNSITAYRWIKREPKQPALG